MAGGSFSKSFEHDFELTASPSCSRRNSCDSDTSWESTLSGTLKGSNSLLSCSESELSVRTGSTAYKQLPPRPAPPPPPPKKPTNPRTTPPNVYAPLSVETAAPFSTHASTERTSTPARNKSISSRTLSLKKKPHLSRTLSSDMFISPQAMSLPAVQMSRTFSSDGLRHILYSLPPAYPPPPPPESPPMSPYAPPPFPESPPLPPYAPIPSAPVLSSAPPPPSTARSKRRISPPGENHMSKSSMQTSAYHKYGGSRSNDGGSCHSNDRSNGRGTCRPCLHLKQRLILMSCMSFLLSLACCLFTAYHFLYRTQDMSAEDIFKNCNRLLETLNTGDQRQYCAKNNDDISDLLVMCIRLKNVCESRNVTLPKNVPVSAHVRVNNQASDNNGTEGLQRLVLSQPGEHSKQPHKEHANCVKMTKDALNVSHAGTYFVYSSIYFKAHLGASDSQVLSQVWKHAIILTRASDGSHETLAHSAHSCTSNCGSDVFTSYTGGIFQLREHDLVSVDVTSKDLVVNKSEGSNLGLFMIAGVMTP